MTFDDSPDSPPPSGQSTLRSRFRAFRRTRPFWGCLLLALGAYFIISPVLTTFTATVSMGQAAVSGWVIGAIMLAAAGVSLISPSQRHFAGIMAMIVSVASLVLTNLGGYIIGMALGIIGSGMVFAWAPGERKPRHRRRLTRTTTDDKEPATLDEVLEDTA